MSSVLHPDGKLSPSDSVSNASGNESIHDLIETRMLSRRHFIKATLGGTAVILAAPVLASSQVKPMAQGLASRFGKSTSVADIGFAPVMPNVSPMIDGVSVPEGYTARILVAWGDSITAAPHWDSAGAMDEATQLHCYGAHTDGMHFFPFPVRHGERVGGLLVSNSEYCDPALVNNISPASAYATTALTLEMVRAQQAALGINIVELRRQQAVWTVQRDSRFNRRITGNTPCEISGPAAGHSMMQTAADPSGTLVLGTLNNCAHGYTPWGTYLACEENFNGYFGSASTLTQTVLEKRYGVTGSGFGYRWHEVDPRFDVNLNRNEPNRFGWVVEIDPFDPNSAPIKRTALGRFKHESAMVVVDSDARVAVYMGDDERNEYVYKFVCANRLERHNRHANRNLLDMGTLYVAKFSADGTGTWMPLVWGENDLTPDNGFADQAEVLIKCRQAADRLGATLMDRPEWIAAHPDTQEIYLALTNNNRRGSTPVSSNNADGSTSAGNARPPVDAANPRPDNDYGHIIRWRDTAGAVDALTFEWDIFVQCGDKATAKTLGADYTPGEFGGQTVGYQGNIVGDDYGAPDGLWFDRQGRLWIQTDQAGDAMGDWVNIGGNAMLCADPVTRETRRFLTGPKYCEVTGVCTTPDGRAMFVGIQHPGEDWVTNHTDNSTWPDSGINGPTTFTGSIVSKPRSAVVVITKDDGGVIGT